MNYIQNETDREMKHLVIIGARGFGREVLLAAQNSINYQHREYDIKGFLDDKPDALDGLRGIFPPILGSVETYEVKENDVFFCALGDPVYREKYARIIEDKGGTFISIISPNAVVSPNASISPGSFISSLSIISDNVTIGKHVIILGLCILGHDSTVKDYGTIESYVFVGGMAEVGRSAVMHTRSSLIPRRKIGQNCVVGASSVVIRNVEDGCHVIGNPAIKLNEFKI